MTEAPPNDSISALADVLGEASTKEIVRLFVESFPESFGSLSDGTPADQLRVVHGLKSSALHMGARGMSERMAEIESRLFGGGALTQDDRAAILADFDSAAPALRRYAGI